MNTPYSQRILQLAGNIGRIGHLDAPQARAHAVSRLCGSKISVELSLDENKCVADYAQHVEACALGQAAAAIMAQDIIGTPAADLHKIAAHMRAMLKENAPPPPPTADGKWQDLAILETVRAYPARHASTLLVFDAVEDCLQQLAV